MKTEGGDGRGVSKKDNQMSVSGQRLKSFVERVERLLEERKTLNIDIKEVYAEAKGTGYDPKIMRLLIRLRTMDQADLDEQEMLLDTYKRILGMLPDSDGNTGEAL